MIKKLFKLKQKNMLFRRTCLLLIALLFTGMLYSQERTIKGTVVDKTGASLPGVNIIIKGTQKGVVTDLNGNFSMTVPDRNSVLVVTYIGYTSQEIPVVDKTEFNIQLEEEVTELNEVVVTGYGVQKKSDLTGAIASVSGKSLQKIPVTGLDQALQGMAAGVNIIPQNGRPGGMVNIQIRGIASINGTKPLIVIDGIPTDEYGFNRMNPDDVESIEVLKDASSAAIYGATGGNGVILITTKKGKAGDVKVIYNAYYGADNVINQLDLMNSQQWLELMDETSTSKHPITLQPDTLKTYNWQDIIFKQAITQNHNLQLTGGTEKSKFIFSTGYSKQDGIVKSTDNQRITMRLNADQNVKKIFTLQENISFVNIENNGFDDWMWTNYYNNPIMPALQMVPYQQAYDSKGKWTVPYGGGINPMVALDLKNKKRHTNNFEGNFSVTVEPLKGLTYVSKFDGVLGFYDDKEYNKKYEASATDLRTQNSLVQSMKRNFSWNVQNILTYNLTLGKHDLTLMGAVEASKWWDYDINGQRVDLPSEQPEMLYLSVSTNDTLAKQIIEGTGHEGRKYSYLGRLNYSFKDRYLFTVSVRRDYSSSFGPNNRAGTFPSFSVGWKFTEEEFMKNVSFLSFGKIRVGYGESGANAKTGFPYLTQIKTPGNFKYSFNNNTSSIGAGPEQVANPSLKWEAVKMTNYGIDLTMFKNKLTFSAEYFTKVNDGMIMSQTVPAVAGTYSTGGESQSTLPEVNIGSFENKGFEFTLGYKSNARDFKYSFDLNISFVKNKVLKLASDDSLQRGSVHIVSPVTLTRVGGSVSEFWGYKTNGMFREGEPMGQKGKRKYMLNQPYKVNANGDTAYMQPISQPGDVRYVDINGDALLTDKDKVDLGSPLPKFTFGFNINLEYKMFDLNAFFMGSYGNKVFNGTKQYLYYAQGYGNRLSVFANRYKDEVIKDGVVVVNANHNTNIPRFNTDNYSRPTAFYIEDGSYLRLRTLQLGVTIPKKLTTKLGIERFRVYVGAKNLFTLTKYTGFDPVVGGDTNGTDGTMVQGIDYGIYPATKMILAGLNLEF